MTFPSLCSEPTAASGAELASRRLVPPDRELFAEVGPQNYEDDNSATEPIFRFIRGVDPSL